MEEPTPGVNLQDSPRDLTYVCLQRMCTAVSGKTICMTLRLLTKIDPVPGLYFMGQFGF